MEARLKTFEANGTLCTALTYDNQPGTIAGTVWRFVLQTETLIATPSRIDGTQPHPHDIPERIESILGGPHGLAALGYAVSYAAQCRTDHNPTFTATQDKLLKADLRKTSQADIDAALKKVESERAQLKQQNHASALDQLKRSLAELGLQKVPQAKLEKLLRYIHQLMEGRGLSPTIRHADYERIIQKAESLTGKKLLAQSWQTA